VYMSQKMPFSTITITITVGGYVVVACLIDYIMREVNT
jgi:hypothetical protein